MLISEKYTSKPLPFWSQCLSRFFSECKHTILGTSLYFFFLCSALSFLHRFCWQLSMFFSPFHCIPFCALPRQSFVLVVCNLRCEAHIQPLMYVKFLSTHMQHIYFPLVILFTFLCLLDDFSLRQALLVGWTSGDGSLAYRVLLYDSSLLNSPVLL